MAGNTRYITTHALSCFISLEASRGTHRLCDHAGCAHHLVASGAQNSAWHYPGSAPPQVGIGSPVCLLLSAACTAVCTYLMTAAALIGVKHLDFILYELILYMLSTAF